MKPDTITIGISDKAAPKIKVPVQDPENLDDLTSLAKGDVNVIVRWGRRGLNIERQERSGARDEFREMWEAGEKDTAKITEALTKTVSEFDPTAAAERGGPRPRKPVDIVVPKGKKFSLEDLKAQLEAKGVKVNFTTDDAAEPAGATA